MSDFQQDNEKSTSELNIVRAIMQHDHHILDSIHQTFQTPLSESQQHVDMAAFTCCLIEHALKGRADIDGASLLSDYTHQMMQEGNVAGGRMFEMQTVKNQMDQFLASFPSGNKKSAGTEKEDFLFLVQMTFCLLYFFQLPTEQAAVNRMLPDILALRVLIDSEAGKHYVQK